MAAGTGGVTFQNQPVSSPWLIDVDEFFSLTSKQVATVDTFPAAGQGQTSNQPLPQTGVISRMRLIFQGTATVATAAVTPSSRWPYGLLDGFSLRANSQNNLFDCDGLDLTARRFLEFPSFTEQVDVFPSVIGGGTSVATGAHPLYLTWLVPIAVDQSSLGASLFAQSSATNLAIAVRQAVNSVLVNTPANLTISGSWTVELTFYEIPYNTKGQMVLPDVTRLHGFNAVDTNITSTGVRPYYLVPGSGQLLRLLMSATSDTNAPLSADPATATSGLIDSIAISYGTNKIPLSWDPAAVLLSENNEYYGAPCPYDRLIWDNVRENAKRDAVLLAGVTNLAVQLGVDPAVTIGAGAVRLVQERLF